jgi:C4-dicarboxylate transporter
MDTIFAGIDYLAKASGLLSVGCISHKRNNFNTMLFALIETTTSSALADSEKMMKMSHRTEATSHMSSQPPEFYDLLPFIPLVLQQC